MKLPQAELFDGQSQNTVPWVHLQNWPTSSELLHQVVH